MARTRKIKPEYNNSPVIARLSHSARLLDICLWPHLDGNGMIENSAMSIKAKVFPLDDIPASQLTVWISELIREGRVFSLEVDNKSWLYRKNFRREQKVYSDETKKCAVLPELLDRCDKGEYLSATACIEGGRELPIQPQLFATSTSTSTSTSPSNSNFSIGDKSVPKEPLPKFSSQPPSWWSGWKSKLKAAAS